MNSVEIKSSLKSESTTASENESALLSWIQQFAPYGVVTLDKLFHIKSWNHWMEIHSARQAKEVIGKNLFIVFPNLLERKLVAYFDRALLGESSVLSTSLHHHLLPLPSTVRETITGKMQQTARVGPLLAEGGVCGLIIVIEDVTQREQQAEVLRRQHRRDEILSWALAHLLKTEEPRKTVRQLFFKIAEHLEFDTFLLYLRDSETGVLSLYTSGGVAADAELEFAEFPLIRAIAENSELRILNAVHTAAEGGTDILKNSGIHAAVAIPLLANDRSLGVLCFATCIRESVTVDESQLLMTIAQYLATAVDRENTSLQLRKVKEQLSTHAQILESRVEERTSRLRETVSELETFSYTLAHDLKAPVRALIAYCKMLQEDFQETLPPAAAEIIQRMVRTPQRMEGLINDLLRFSEISRQEVVLSGIDVELIVEDILLLRAADVRKATTIETPLHPVLGNRLLLHQALSNLIDNAFKFVGNLPPTITIRTELVAQMSSSTRSTSLLFNSIESPAAVVAYPETTLKRVRIWVTDEGIGIPQALHEKSSEFLRGEFPVKNTRGPAWASPLSPGRCNAWAGLAGSILRRAVEADFGSSCRYRDANLAIIKQKIEEFFCMYMEKCLAPIVPKRMLPVGVWLV